MPSAVGEDGTGHVRAGRRPVAVAGAICALLWGYLGWQLGKQADRRTEVRVAQLWRVRGEPERNASGGGFEVWLVSALQGGALVRQESQLGEPALRLKSQA